MKIKTYQHGYASMERIGFMWVVKCYLGTELYDKIRCDDYTAAKDYFRAFKAIAKNH
jgi:hypothetical protein